MAINFDSVISNTKGAANIAKLKVTLGLKTNELNKLYSELGKFFYECTKNNQTDYMADEQIRDCLEKIPSLEQEIATLESQVSNEKDSMKPIDTPKEPMQSGYGQPNYSQGPAASAESGVKCPKCGAMQSSDNEFCIFCVTKMSE